MRPFSLLNQVLTKNEIKLLGFVGIKKTLNPRDKFTSLERKYYDMLNELGVCFIAQYPMGGRYYDAFLPDQNILFEFDGTFWHPLNEEDCKYPFQHESMKVDKLKTNMAKQSGIKIIRIREESPITTDQMRKLIWD